MASDGDDKTLRLVGLGQLLLGGSLIVRGLMNVRRVPVANGGVNGMRVPGGRQLADAPVPSEEMHGKIIAGVKFYKVANIDERVKYIKQLINKGSLHPAVREKATEILGKKCGEKYCVREKDYMGEISALFWALRDPKSPDSMRYVRDHNKVDQFFGADKLQKLHAGDCDDGALLLASWLMAVGYPCKLRVVGAKGAGTFTHIYNLVGIPPTGPTRWISLDWSVVQAKPGWEVEGARECALTGRPAGAVDRVKDYDL